MSNRILRLGAASALLCGFIVLAQTPSAPAQLMLLSANGSSPAVGGGACASSAYVDLNGTHYPDESCAGVPAGTSLTSYSGPTTITVDGTAISAKTITECPLTIQAINVTIDDSHFDCTNSQALVVDDDFMYAETSNGTVYAVTVSDTTIDCGSTSGGLHGVSEAHFYLLRVEIRDCENGLDINQNVRVEDSILHLQAAIGGDPHEDSIQEGSGSWNGSDYTGPIRNIYLIGNTLDGQANTGNPGTSAVITNPDGSGLHVVTGNWFMGAGYSLYCPDDDTTGWTFTGNVFSTTYYSTVGSIAGHTDCGQFATEGTWSGNYCAETGATVAFNSGASVCAE